MLECAVAFVVALVDDLMFLSRIREAARAAGVEVRAVRGVDAVVQASRDGARLVLLDLDSPRMPWSEALAALAGQPASAPATVGFFGHVHAETGRAAEAAGCTLVLPRGAFVGRLPALLADPPRRP
jgi:DNA-binding NarL/FixJ family response regulator